jgi:hypothetical protein
MKKSIKGLFATLLSVVCVWNCVQFQPVSAVATESESEMKQEFYVSNAGYASIENVTLEDGRAAVKIVPKLSETAVYWAHEAFDGVKAGAQKHVDFQMYVGCNEEGYDGFSLNTWGGLPIDYGFKRNAWNRVNFDGNIFHKEGEEVVCLLFENAIGKEIYITDVTVNDDTFTTEGIFGGVELYQYEPNSIHQTMMNGYVLVTPDQKLVVQDGGYIGDEEEL